MSPEEADMRALPMMTLPSEAATALPLASLVTELPRVIEPPASTSPIPTKVTSRRSPEAAPTWPATPIRASEAAAAWSIAVSEFPNLTKR
jgi:hypothetical protein